MDRRSVVSALQRTAFAEEVLGGPPEGFPPLDPEAVAGLAWALRSLEGDIVTLHAEGALGRLSGMTLPALSVVDDVLGGRPAPRLVALERALPAGLLELHSLKGLGPKKVRRLWQELGIESLGELEYACRENRLLQLKGFGDKTQQSLLQQIEERQATSGLLRRDHALALVVPVLSKLRASGARAELAGDLPRGLELVEQLTVVTTAPPPAPPSEPSTSDAARRVTVVAGVAPTRFGATQLRATASAGFFARLQAAAAARGIDLSELEATEEDGVFAALGFLPSAPEQRHDHSPLIEVGRARPPLVQRKDLRGALHNHTTASDGADDLEAMRGVARARGLAYLGISDHSQSAVYAHGLSAPVLAEQRATIQRMNADGSDSSACVLLSGVESDILADGTLDYADDVLASCDVVVASVHQRYGQKGRVYEDRVQRAAAHPAVHVIGHPTGRLLLSRAPVDYDVAVLLASCAMSGCAVELNANPARLDLSARWLHEAKERGVLVSIAADAHAVAELDNLEHGVALARSAGLGPEHVLNTRTLPELRAWLLQRTARALSAAR